MGCEEDEEDEDEGAAEGMGILTKVGLLATPEVPVEVVELLPDKVTDRLEEVLDVDGGTETDVDVDVLLV